MKLKRMMVTVLIVVLAMCQPVFAAGGSAGMEFRVQPVDSSTADVILRLTDNPGLAGWSGEICFDAQKLTLVNISAEAMFQDGTFIANPDFAPGVAKVLFAGSVNNKKTGDALRMRFKTTSGQTNVSEVIRLQNVETVDENQAEIKTETKAAELKLAGGGSGSGAGGGSAAAGQGQAGGTPAGTDPASGEFVDIAGHWARNSILSAAQKGIVKGVGGGRFAPDKAMTRAEFVTMLANLSGEDMSAFPAAGFVDVEKASWYNNQVAWAVSKGIATGTGQGRFSPDKVITREQMALMIYRYMNLKGMELAGTAEPTAFSDSAGIMEAARPAVAALQRGGIVSGKGANRFCPLDGATRAELVTILMKIDQ